MYLHHKFRQVPLEIRRTAVEQILSGEKRQVDVANELGLRRQTVHAWVSRARRGQPPATRGRPATPEFSEEEHQRFIEELVQQLPADFGYRSARRWNWQTVMLHAQAEYGVRIYRSYAIRLLQEACPPKPRTGTSAATRSPRSSGPLKPSELQEMERRIAATQTRLREKGIAIGDDGLPRI